MYVLVNPDGSRWWRLKYRFGGRERAISLGVYPTISLKRARERRTEAKSRLADGIDPSQERREEKLSRAVTFELIAREWLELHEMAAPLIFSPRLGLLEVHLHPWETIGGAISTIGVIAFLIWVYRQLRAPAVLAAYGRPGHPAGPPWLAFLLGAAFAVGVGTVAGLALHGDGAQKAMELARAKVGNGYRYCVSNLSWAGGHGRAKVIAYRDDTIRTVDVEW
jgi:Arm DNA-binding domain